MILSELKYKLEDAKGKKNNGVYGQKSSQEKYGIRPLFKGVF